MLELGPLIMVVTFVAFVGGWLRQVLGPNLLFTGAALAAMLVTWFIASLALFFLLHIARGRTGTGTGFGIGWIALALAAAAAVALLRYQIGVIPVIAGCGLAGLVLRLSGWA